jgi:hypothetical protein
MTTGRIEEARKSQSGKTLGVKINGKWYSTKHWEMENMVGETITITDHGVQEWQGQTIHWLNEYQISTDQVPGVPQSASAAREHNRGRPDANDNYTESVLLLRFVGQCFTGYPFQTTDMAAVRSRAKMLYELGQDILSGKITEVETGPRRANTITQQIPGIHRPKDEPRGDEPPYGEPDDDFDTQDIPF